MLGYRILVSTQTPEQLDSGGDHKQLSLAQWETGVSGIEWLKQLVEEGKATKLHGNGYTNRYVSKARDVLPIITGNGIKPADDGVWIFGVDEGEEYVHPPGWEGETALKSDNVDACQPDTSLTIDAWDQSQLAAHPWKNHACCPSYPVALNNSRQWPRSAPAR